MTKESIAIAIESMSWMAYTGIGERSALLKASRQLELDNVSDLRQAHRMIMETTRFQNRVDWVISQTMSREKFDQAPHGVRNLLRILGYSKFVDAKRQGQLESMVGWGRQILGWREIRPYEEYIARLVSSRPRFEDRGLPEFEGLALETCHPAWYVERLVLTFGRVFALKILKRNLHPVSAFARVNSLKTKDEPAVAKQLNGTRVNGVANTYLLDGSTRPTDRAELSASGIIVLQDLASIVAGLVAAPKPGERVLDLCASPGNKTTHLAAQMENKGEIYSVELSRARLLQWEREVIRTGCVIATPIRADAANLPLHNQMDVVLVDPPCSNTGVFARNPASKWRTSPPRLSELASKQATILQAASEHLAPGGTLVYCTCSVLPEENEFIVETFLKRNPEFRLVPQTPLIGSPGLRGSTKCQRFYSHLHDCNGYFIAKMSNAD